MLPMPTRQSAQTVPSASASPWYRSLRARTVAPPLTPELLADQPPFRPKERALARNAPLLPEARALVTPALLELKSTTHATREAATRMHQAGNPSSTSSGPMRARLSRIAGEARKSVRLDWPLQKGPPDAGWRRFCVVNIPSGTGDPHSGTTSASQSEWTRPAVHPHGGQGLAAMVTVSCGAAYGPPRGPLRVHPGPQKSSGGPSDGGWARSTWASASCRRGRGDTRGDMSSTGSPNSIGSHAQLYPEAVEVEIHGAEANC